MQNVRTWAEENPHGVQQVTLHGVNVVVWYTASVQEITDLILLQETVNLDWFVISILNSFFNVLSQ
jgi:hypothetical protein